MPEINNSELGPFIKNILNEKHWSIRQAALKIDVSAAYLSKLINHKADSNPKPATLRKLAKGLRVNEDQIFKAAGEDFIKSNQVTEDKNNAVEIDSALDDGALLMYQGKEIPEEDLELIRRILKGK